LLAAGLDTYRPRTVVRVLDPRERADVALPAALRGMLTADAPRAYLCAGSVCAPPAADADALRTLLRTWHA
jgi:uncharacterized protein YyaL (SSP411 family)